LDELEQEGQDEPPYEPGKIRYISAKHMMQLDVKLQIVQRFSIDQLMELAGLAVSQVGE
jgi:NAD(P)H-hydrate repair Nnr-like enzyme with NAD(P)H-hydrate epimerase domain